MVNHENRASMDTIREQLSGTPGISEVQRNSIIEKLSKINASLEEYKAKGVDVSYIRTLFESRMDAIADLLGNRAVHSENIMALLNKENLLTDGILEIENGDSAGKTLYKFNINPEKAFADGNTALKDGSVEFLTTEATLVVKLKELEKAGAITFGKDDIPVLNPSANLLDQLKMVEIMKDYIALQLTKNIPDDKRQEFLRAQTQLESIKLENPFGGMKAEEQKSMIGDFERNLKQNLGDLPEVKTGSIPKEQKDLLTGITDWFESRSDEEKILIIGLIATVGIVGIISMGPVIVPFLEGAALRGFLSFLSLIEKSRTAAFALGLTPGSGSIIRATEENLPNSSRMFLTLGNMSKDILQNIFLLIQKLTPELEQKRGVA